MRVEAVRVLPSPCPSCSSTIARGSIAAVSRPDAEFDELFKSTTPDFCWPCQHRLLAAYEPDALAFSQKCRTEVYEVFLRRSVAAG
jgi:hypothetical protein